LPTKSFAMRKVQLSFRVLRKNQL